MTLYSNTTLLHLLTGVIKWVHIPNALLRSVCKVSVKIAYHCLPSTNNSRVTVAQRYLVFITRIITLVFLNKLIPYD